jgi:hypothetical protein
MLTRREGEGLSFSLEELASQLHSDAHEKTRRARDQLTFDDAPLRELAESIRAQGVLSPVLVRSLTEQSFEIVAGARRFRAAQIALGVAIRVHSSNAAHDSAKLMLATMPMLIYKPCRADMKGFVKFWSSQYNWIVEPAIYDDNIGLELTEGRIWKLFRWKNGGPLSKLKEKTVRQNFVGRRAELKGLPKNQQIEALLDRFSQGGAIWRIFWLHCWQPKRFPIYDQHVHRAMTFIKTGACEEIPVPEIECK